MSIPNFSFLQINVTILFTPIPASCILQLTDDWRYIHEKTVDNFAKRMELPVIENRCPVDKHTKREEIKQLVYDLSATYPDLKERIFGAMQRLPLPEWGTKGRYNRPKDDEE